MPQPDANKAGHAGALMLLERLKAMKSDWPSEPELRHLDESTLNALLDIANTNHQAEVQYGTSLALLIAIISVGLTLAVTLPAADKTNGRHKQGIMTRNFSGIRTESEQNLQGDVEYAWLTRDE